MLIPSKFNGYSRDGRREYHLDSGSSAPAPQQTSVSQSTVPEYARPYMEELLGRAQAATKTPYQTYEGERIAGFTPLQQQAFTSAGNMSAGPEAFSSQVQQYMSPYVQNVIDVTKREATRASDIAGERQQAQAAQTGAFGGYRDAIERAERERNLGTQLNDIQTRGLQAAFDQASSQFRQGIAQGMDINRLQSTAGAQQQQLEQQRLGQQYQDFINQQNFPYKQIGFMSDVLRGVPGTQAANTVYSAPPSTTSQLAGLGTLAYGLSKKKGGVIDVEAKPVKRKEKKASGLQALALQRMK